jgi:predicted Zn-dependent protease with MMP-like domain
LRGVVDVAPDRFEELVADALDSIPSELGRLMDNVAVVVEEGTVRGLLGLYRGVPLTRRDRGYDGMVMPDRITIYRLAICARCRTEDEVVHQVRVTVIHEVGHHFGIDDARLRELGWA